MLRIVTESTRSPRLSMARIANTALPAPVPTVRRSITPIQRPQVRCRSGLRECMHMTEENQTIDPMTALANRQADLEKQIAALTDMLNKSVEQNTKLMETNARILQAQQVPDAKEKAKADQHEEDAKIQELALASLKRTFNIKE